MAVRVNIQLGWKGSMPRDQHMFVLSVTADCICFGIYYINICIYPTLYDWRYILGIWHMRKFTTMHKTTFARVSSALVDLIELQN